MAFGVTTLGFIAKTAADLKTDLRGSWRSVLGASVNVDDRSRNGQMIAAFAAALAEVWQLGEALAQAFSQPTGILLDYVSALTGTFRLAATPSAATLTLTGTPTTVVGIGKVAGVNGTTGLFATLAPATIGAATPWANGTTYVAGVRRTANGNIYLCQVGGSSSGLGTGPAGTGVNIDDNGVKWDYLGAGTGFVDVAAQATLNGPTPGYSRTITVISTPVAGWNGVINILDAVLGTFLESDVALRVRRSTEAAGQGFSPVNAIRARMLRLAGVTSCVVFENYGDATVDGVDPHSVECLVEGGDDTAIAQRLFDSRAGGIGNSGTTSVTITDSAGNGHTMKFSRPADVNIYVGLVVQIDPNAFPADGLEQIKEAIADGGNQLGVGRDVYDSPIGSLLFAKDENGAPVIPGIIDVDTLVDTVHPAVQTHVAVSTRQRARFDTSRVDVVATPGAL